MKIQIVCQNFYPEPCIVNDIVKYLSKSGHTVRVLTATPDNVQETIKDDYIRFQRRKEEVLGASVDRVPVISRKKGGKFRLILNYLSFMICSIYRCLFIDIKADVVLIMQPAPITACYAGLLYAKLTKTPSLIYCMEPSPASAQINLGVKPDSLIHKIMVKFSRGIYKKASRIAISSKSYNKYFDEVIELVKAREYLPPFLNYDAKAAPLPNNKYLRIVYIDEMENEQCISTVLRAANILKDNGDIHWDIIGKGPQLRDAYKLSNSLGVRHRITFHGHINNNDLPFYYDNADVIVASLIDNDIISLAMPSLFPSYLASGRPIVASLGGEGARIIKQARCGIVCKSQDAVELANSVAKLYVKRDDNKMYGMNAYNYFKEHFTQEVFNEKLMALLEEMIKEVRNVQEKDSTHNRWNRIIR